MKKQTTFYGDECERKALEWLENMRKLYWFGKITMETKVYTKYKDQPNESLKCKVIISYRWKLK